MVRLQKYILMQIIVQKHGQSGFSIYIQRLRKISISNPIRVVMISHNYYPLLGGAERQIAALNPLLMERGVDIHIVTRRYPNLVAYEVVDGVPVHRIYSPKPIASPMFTLGALPVIRRLKPDVIHAFSLFSPLTTAAIAKTIVRKPVVVKLLRGGVLGDMIRLQNKRLGQTRIKWFKKSVDAFISISQEITEELAQIGVTGQQSVFIPNGVDTERFKPVSSDEKKQLRQELGLPTEGTLVIFTGRLVPEKQLDRLIQLWPQIREKYPDSHLAIVGSGQEVERLEALKGENVHLVGYADDVAPYLAAADSFVLPSVSEGLSNALLEAMASGLPAIVTNVGGASDVITHGENGWLITPEDSDNLQQALENFIGDATLREKIGLAGRQKVIQDYALTGTADRLRDLYERLHTGGDS